MIVSGYKTMWILVLFDLPTKTKKERRDYTTFRKKLIKDGFNMIQYSVYVRSCPSLENVNVHANRIKSFLPPEGQVRVLTFTDHQFSKQKIFWGKKRKPTEKSPEQLEFF